MGINPWINIDYTQSRKSAAVSEVKFFLTFALHHLVPEAPIPEVDGAIYVLHSYK